MSKHFSEIPRESRARQRYMNVFPLSLIVSNFDIFLLISAVLNNPVNVMSKIFIVTLECEMLE